jgi:hypothetical protein
VVARWWNAHRCWYTIAQVHSGQRDYQPRCLAPTYDGSGFGTKAVVAAGSMTAGLTQRTATDYSRHALSAFRVHRSRHQTSASPTPVIAEPPPSPAKDGDLRVWPSACSPRAASQGPEESTPVTHVNCRRVPRRSALALVSALIAARPSWGWFYCPF